MLFVQLATTTVVATVTTRITSSGSPTIFNGLIVSSPKVSTTANFKKLRCRPPYLLPGAWKEMMLHDSTFSFGRHALLADMGTLKEL